MDTTKAGSASNRMIIPARNVSTYNCRVYWGDGTYSNITTWNSANLTHDYAVGGTYDIQIAGTFRALHFNNGGDRQKLLRLDQWGSTGWDADQGHAFRDCNNLTALPADMALTGVTSALYMNPSQIRLR